MTESQKHPRQFGVRQFVCALLLCALALTSGPVPALAAIAAAGFDAPGLRGGFGPAITHYDGDRGGGWDKRGLAGGRAVRALNRLSVLDHYRVGTAQPIVAYNYGLLANGQRRSVQEGNGRSCLYAYDNLWRLTGETITADPHGKNGIAAYTYDVVGNRQTRTSTVAALPAQTFGYDADDRVQGDAYDANGNTKSGAVSQPASVLAAEPSTTGTPPVSGADTYDSQNRLIARNGSGSVQVVYDGDGNKVQESVTQNGLTTVTTYLVDSLNPTGYTQVLEEKTNGTLTRVYTWGLELISQDQVAGGSWQVSYYGYDGHGNVRFLSDATGNITDAYDFDAFGNLLNISTGMLAGGGAAPPTVNLHLYCGEQFDAGLGMYYLRARLMNPLTGRFWSVDVLEGQLEDPNSLHKYLYSNADPIALRDPTGMASLGEINIASAISAGLASMAILSPIRAYQFANEVTSGISLAQASENALLGLATDFALGAVGGAIFEWVPQAFRVLRVGQAFTRAANSVWNLGWSARGFAIEKMILGRLPAIKGVVGRLQEVFPVIDDFTNGIATSIKSIDLRAATYQNASALKSVISRYATQLAAFKGAIRGTVNVTNAEINEKLLVIVTEDGAATVQQLQAINQAVFEAGSKFVRVVLTSTP